MQQAVDGIHILVPRHHLLLNYNWTCPEAAYELQHLVAVIIGYLAFMDMGLDLPVTKPSLKSEPEMIVRPVVTFHFGVFAASEKRATIGLWNRAKSLASR